MVDTDQEKEALAILSAKSRNHSVEEKRKRKRKKKKEKERGKKKMENEFVLHELTKAVLNGAFYKIACQVWGCSNPVFHAAKGYCFCQFVFATHEARGKSGETSN